MSTVQRTGARANRYDHTPRHLPDGRWVMTRQAAAHLGNRDVDHVRKIAEEQRRRWVAGQRQPDEQPIEVLCALHPVTRKRAAVLLDVDALTAAIATRPFADWKRRKPVQMQ